MPGGLVKCKGMVSCDQGDVATRDALLRAAGDYFALGPWPNVRALAAPTASKAYHTCLDCEFIVVWTSQVSHARRRPGGLVKLAQDTAFGLASVVSAAAGKIAGDPLGPWRAAQQASSAVWEAASTAQQELNRM